MQFDSDPSHQADPASNREEQRAFALDYQFQHGVPVTMFTHTAGTQIQVHEVSPDRLLFILPDCFVTKEFLFDRSCYEEGAEEYLYEALADILTAYHSVPEDLSQVAFTPTASYTFPDLSTYEVQQPTQAVCGRIDALLLLSQSPRERVVLQRLKRSLEEHYDKEYGTMVKRYLRADQEAELDSDSVYHTMIHYTSLEEMSSMFQKASVVPLYSLDDPKALDHVLEDLKRFQESTLEPKLFHDSFMMKMADYLMHASPEEEKEPPKPFSGGGGFLFPDDDFID